ncbi:MAG: hypothetical protein ACRETM_13355 [Stenotrophobium sp.]
MDNSPITTDAEYRATLRKIESLMYAAADTPHGKHLDTLVTAVEAYERMHFSMASSDTLDSKDLHVHVKSQ